MKVERRASVHEQYRRTVLTGGGMIFTGMGNTAVVGPRRLAVEWEGQDKGTIVVAAAAPRTPWLCFFRQERLRFRQKCRAKMIVLTHKPIN